MAKGKILVCGGGFIGARIQEVFDCDISAARITSLADADREIKRHQPDILINCIGHTGKINVDGCEDNPDATLIANVNIPILFAEAAIRNNIKLVHLSSGCIYNFDYSKDKPITEEKTPDFFDLFYSRTKIYSERALEILSKHHNILIVRIRVPLDDRPHRRNLLTKLIAYKNIIDVPNSVTYIPDFLKAVSYLLEINARGVFNVVNKGGLYYKDLMNEYQKYHPDFEYTMIPVSKLEVKRTSLLLSTRKLESVGFKIRPIKEVIPECVSQYVRF